MTNFKQAMLRIASLMICGLVAGVSGSGSANATEQPATLSNDLLVKVETQKASEILSMLNSRGALAQKVTDTLRDGTQWLHLKVPQTNSKLLSTATLRTISGVLVVQPNYEIRLLEKPLLRDQEAKDRAAAYLMSLGKYVPGYSPGAPPAGVVPGAAPAPPAMADNPAIPELATGNTGADPDAAKQWGMIDNNVKTGWSGRRGEGAVVAVIDSGVDYTHEDLVENMWRNPGETGKDSQGRNKSTNGVDDDANGYVDDVVGWDFATNDNKPFDLAYNDMELMMMSLQGQGGNPGHGTHCAGNVAARGENGKGITGVAPRAKIMALRFLTEAGAGDTVGAVKAIQYSIKMGAKISSDSWGSSGEDPADPVGNQALRDVIEEARLAGQLFIAAAGNGDEKGKGYDNDNSKVPSFPATYPHENIISVAAIDSSDGLGGFSNWGKTSVDIGAPGVKVFSTMVGNAYNDSLLFGMATWDGTSMAAPHVAGAAALYWADNPNATMEQVKRAILSTVKPTGSLSGKVVSGGKLSVENLMK